MWSTSCNYDEHHNDSWLPHLCLLMPTDEWAITVVVKWTRDPSYLCDIATLVDWVKRRYMPSSCASNADCNTGPLTMVIRHSSLLTVVLLSQSFGDALRPSPYQLTFKIPWDDKASSSQYVQFCGNLAGHADKSQDTAEATNQQSGWLWYSIVLLRGQGTHSASTAHGHDIFAMLHVIEFRASVRGRCWRGMHDRLMLHLKIIHSYTTLFQRLLLCVHGCGEYWILQTASLKGFWLRFWRSAVIGVGFLRGWRPRILHGDGQCAFPPVSGHMILLQAMLSSWAAQIISAGRACMLLWVYN